MRFHTLAGHERMVKAETGTVDTRELASPPANQDAPRDRFRLVIGRQRW